MEETWYLIYDKENYVMFPESSVPASQEIVTLGKLNTEIYFRSINLNLVNIAQ